MTDTYDWEQAQTKAGNTVTFHELMELESDFGLLRGPMDCEDGENPLEFAFGPFEFDFDTYGVYFGLAWNADRECVDHAFFIFFPGYQEPVVQVTVPGVSLAPEYAIAEDGSILVLWNRSHDC